MFWKIKHKLFGWDYIGWSNSASDGVARIYVSGDGRPYFWRYKLTKVIDYIDTYSSTEWDHLVWLTCPPTKYLPLDIKGERAIQSIINLVDKELPERKTMTNVPLILPSANDNWGRAQASREGFMYGYNQAIDDIRSKLHA